MAQKSCFSPKWSPKSDFFIAHRIVSHVFFARGTLSIFQKFRYFYRGFACQRTQRNEGIKWPKWHRSYRHWIWTISCFFCPLFVVRPGGAGGVAGVFAKKMRRYYPHSHLVYLTFAWKCRPQRHQYNFYPASLSRIYCKKPTFVWALSGPCGGSFLEKI